MSSEKRHGQAWTSADGGTWRNSAASRAGLRNSFSIIRTALFGTDYEPGEEMYRNYFRWLETADEYFEY